MTPFQFRSARKLYKQTQAEWAASLGFEGRYAASTIGRYEAGRVAIPGPIARLVGFMVEAHLQKMRERLIPSDLMDFRPAQVLRVAAEKENV